MMIYHIHWGTSGNGGLYIDEIYEVLKEEGYDQEVFVSRYYPFDYGNKIFFRNSDISHCKCSGKRRTILKGIDTIYALSIILIKGWRQKPELINYSLVSGCYSFVFLFLKALKNLTGARIMITCHDVLPFAEKESAFRKEMKNRKALFDWADYLLVHNKSSKETLLDKFEVQSSKIYYHSFPVQDQLKLHPLIRLKKEYDFLFIGHLRKAKGIEILLDSWMDFWPAHKKAKLCIAGKNISDLKIKEEYKSANIDFKLHYISDNEFCDLVFKSRYVVLPYINGTNSGIVSDVLSLDASVIASDLPMFRDNPLLDKTCLFTAGDRESFVKMMEVKYKDNSYSNVRGKVDQYKKVFTHEVIDVYRVLKYDCKK